MPGLNLRGDITNNLLVGSDENDTLVGRRGLDTVIGLSGDDLIWGNDDDDRLFGNAGKDTLYGGKNNDTLEGGQGDDRLLGNQGHDVILGNDGNDVVLGGGGNDLVFGGVGDDSLFGNSGNDVLFGGQGNDAIYGGKGNDHIEGDKGDDTIYGDVGADTITGGDGRDVIVLEESSRVALDTITDFQPSEDAVRLPDGTTYAELVFESDAAGGTVVRDGRSGKALLVLQGVSSTTLTPQNFQSSNTQSTPDSGAPQPPATETPQENDDTPDIPIIESDPQPEPDTPVDNTELEPETPAENPEPDTPPTNNTPDPVPNTPPPADPPPDPIPENQPPIAIDDIATTEFNTAIEISVLNNDTDPDGDALTVTVDEDSASNGTVTTDGATVTYTPNADFTGIDRVTYTVSDGTDSDTGSIEIEVEPEPVFTANDDYFDTELNRPIERIDDDILDNDINPSDRPLTLTFDENPATRGTLVTDEWGGVTYIPEPGFRGIDTFTYTISNGIKTDTAVVEVYVPEIEAQDDVFVIPYGTSVEMDLFANDIYPDDMRMDWGLSVGYMNGTVTPSDGYAYEFTSANRPTFTYTPNPDFVGVETFEYIIYGDGEDWATVTIVTTDAIWLGGDGAAPTNWSNPNNWKHGQVPDFRQSVLIPTSATYQPVLTEYSEVRDLTVEDGASLDVADFVLQVHGHLNALGSITGNRENSRVEVEGFWDSEIENELTLQGTLPNLYTNGFVKVAGATTIEGNLDGGFDLNGHEVTITGDVYAQPDGLIMDDPSDVLNIGGKFGTSHRNRSYQLTAGTINIWGETTWNDSSVESIRASGTHTVVLKGSEYQRIYWEEPRWNEEQYFQNLEIDSSSEVNLNNIQVNGTLTLTNGIVRGQKVFINGNLVDNTELANTELQPWEYPWGLESSWQVDETIVTAANPILGSRLSTNAIFVNQTTLASDLSLIGNLNVDDRYSYDSDAVLSLGGNEVYVLGDFKTQGENASLVMAHPDDVLTIGGKFSLEEITKSHFTAGTLKLQEDEPFGNHYNYYHRNGLNGYVFRASGTHTVSFNGSARQTVPDLSEYFFDPEFQPSFFQNVEIDNWYGVKFQGNTTINGNVILTQGDVIAPYAEITIGGDLIADPDGNSGDWKVGRTKFTGENPQLPAYLQTTATFTDRVTLPRRFTLDGGLIVEETGELTLDGSVSISGGITFFMSDGFEGLNPDDTRGSIDIDRSEVLYVGDLDTTATIPAFRLNQVFRSDRHDRYPYRQLPSAERLLIRVEDGNFHPFNPFDSGRELRHGAITDVRFGDDLEIVTNDGTITLGGFNEPDALAEPDIVNLTTGYDRDPGYYRNYGTHEGGSLLARNDEGELWGTQWGDRIIGKVEAQTIDGGDGQDIISGGAGADILTGGNHLDIFAYDNPSEGGDTITDFSASQEDKIQFGRENFSNPTIEFNVAAASTGQATVYATPLSGGTQQVMFDADGNGAAQPVHLATLTNLSVALEDGDISGYGAYPFDSSSSMR